MTELYQVYKCNVCGNIVEVLHTGRGQLVCCGKPMELMAEKKEDVGQEKHVPVIEPRNGKIKVRVGEVPHPMEEAHYIEWIELHTGEHVERVHLKPGDQPEATFLCPFGTPLYARAYCNIHGLWRQDTFPKK
ncbi:desulfoferrodoxin [Ammonifex thiophilus]|uniref:Desulfoferrodoxin n=1 Tax=Ammonifex thiophilus TaxID=444093 RepID=A0A3D8P3V7_9THEO|nr:desulfoferrodoxin [Ammonifex thiophilus]RDV83618.1 desulfoferrodoxin [Ammonifex thiophilus]